MIPAKNKKVKMMGIKKIGPRWTPAEHLRFLVEFRSWVVGAPCDRGRSVESRMPAIQLYVASSEARYRVSWLSFPAFARFFVIPGRVVCAARIGAARVADVAVGACNEVCRFRNLAAGRRGRHHVIVDAFSMSLFPVVGTIDPCRRT